MPPPKDWEGAYFKLPRQLKTDAQYIVASKRADGSNPDASLTDVVERALRTYVARNRARLDDTEEPTP